MRTSALLLLVLASPLVAQQRTPGMVHPDPIPQIMTSAHGEVKVTPDRATIFIGVQTRAATAAAASAQNASKQRAVLDTIRARGVPPELISTVEYNVYPEQVFDRDAKGEERNRIVGYNVTNTVRVEVRKLDDLGSIIDAALAKGANGINSLQFFSSRADSARRAALADAVVKARADAEALAGAAGGRLGELIELVASPMYSPPRPYLMSDLRQAKAAEATPISPGEQSIDASVTARWRFVGARD